MSIMEHEVTQERVVTIPTKIKISQHHADLLGEIEEFIKSEIGFRPLKSELHVTIFEKGIEFYHQKLMRK
jgi:hypothetical protein